MANYDDLINNIGESFFEFQTKLQFYEKEYLRKHEITDVSPTEIKVLYQIGISNTKSMSDIARGLMITKGTLSITVNTLVKKGYIIRNRHKQDRRVIVLYLTKKAILVIKKYQKFYNQLLTNLMKEIKLQDAINLNNVLSKLNEIIDTFYDED
ncbi:MAG TPA: MarR family transcriptional regulator [Acholeplasmataceae bacterium]|jgi:DNA-binding MarR family transcriptional regulator|nr:MarR family transcriptional regulator [Acholeplasmataceae bacterium]